MQVCCPDLMLTTTWNMEIRRTQHMAHLIRETQFPQMLALHTFRAVNCTLPVAGNKRHGRVWREDASPIPIHLLERGDCIYNRLCGMRTGKLKRHQEIGKKFP